MSKVKQLVRGIRNHNPGNIRITSPRTPWQGRRETLTDDEFEQFVSPVWGLRALARTLIVYQDKHNLRTISEIINRWAPPVENHTGAYVRAVANAMRRGEFDIIDVTDYDTMLALMRAIVRHENGDPKTAGHPQWWYAPEVYDEALRRAGIVPKVSKSILKDERVQAGGAIVGLEAVQQVGPYIPVVREYVQPDSITGQVIGVLVAVAVVYLIVRAVRKHRAQA